MLTINNILVFISLCFLLNLHIGVESMSDDPIVVTTESGRIAGKVSTTLLENRPFLSFKGIPYGKPPIGDLRFKVNSYNLCFVLVIC